MIFSSDKEVIDYIKSNEKIADFIKLARQDEKTLTALIDGNGFTEELINRIEHLESSEKAMARKKYSRDVADFFERLLLPISNVFSSAGTTKKFDLKDKELETFIKTLSNISHGKGIQNYTENIWMPLYHSDPNGIIFMEYVSKPELKVYPTYKSIHRIRHYILKGQVLDVLLFEPIIEETRQIWRVVDDKKDYTVIQIGDSFTIDQEKTFEHPFGEVPGFVNSDILDIKKGIRVSPIQKIVSLSKEYARDQSVKTLYKFLQGFPIHWRYVTQCRSCTGVGKVNNPDTTKNGKVDCGECDGHGYYKKKDVTDIVTMPVPTKDGVKLAPDIAGYISPDLKTWDQYNTEIKILETLAQDTHWGTHVQEGSNQTATGRFIDVQPVINRLNKYADIAEWVEWKITEWVANATLTTKEKEKSIALITYGRRYIIDSPDTILEKYEQAKEKGDNSTILDRLMIEYLTAKYKSDPEWLFIELLKIKVEPYIHMSIADVKNVFGETEAQKKAYFQKWWAINEQIILKKDYDIVNAKFLLDFEAYQLTIKPTANSQQQTI